MMQLALARLFGVSTGRLEADHVSQLSVIDIQVVLVLGVTGYKPGSIKSLSVAGRKREQSRLGGFVLFSGL